MKFEQPLIEGKLIKRYKRFFADVELNGAIVTAHVPNTGSLKSCNTPGSPCLLSPATNPERVLKFTLEAIKAEDHWVGVNTSWPNKLALELFKNKTLAHWSAYDCIQPEVKINSQSRIDLVLWDSQQNPTKKWKMDDFLKPQPVHFVEIKNVTLKDGPSVQFPDAVTERGQKHIQELVKLMQNGVTAELLFIVQRTDGERFAPAATIDPQYTLLLQQALQQGLKVTALSFEVSPQGIEFFKVLPLIF